MEHQHQHQQQPISPHDESTVSANPSPDAAFAPHPRQKSLDSTSGFAILPLPNASSSSSSHEQAMPYAAYANTNAAWDAYSPYLNTADALHIPPVIYNDNSSLMYHSAYGFNPDIAYGQYSPVATHLPSIMLDGQLYSPQHFPFSPSFYPPNVPSSAPLTPTELMTSDSSADNLSFGAGSGYLLPFGSFGGGNMPGTPGSSTLPSSAHYPQPMGILGPYEHHAGQVSQQTPMHGYGLTSSSSIGHYQHGVSYHSSNFGSGSVSYAGGNNQVQLTFDKGRRKERNQEPFYASNDSLGFDHNRGPRASRVKAKSSSEHSSSSGNLREDSSGAKVSRALYNKPDFVTDYNIAKFFIIKSFSEDNVHKSIKYSVWASTPHGNKKMDAAYHEAKEKDGNCPVFLLFSVNASGQFCGVAEMVGAVDFEKDVDYWQQDRWSGQFPVKWHIIKDVPNSRFRHILLENNDNKPVTHSRDSQEVKLEQGIEMLKIFKDHVAHTSILDDFDFYNERERALKERKTKQQINSTTDAPGLIGDETINQVSDSFRQTLQFDVGSKEATREMPTTGSVTTPATNSHAAVQPGNDSSRLVSQTEDAIDHQLSRALNFKGGESQILAAELVGDNQD